MKGILWSWGLVGWKGWYPYGLAFPMLCSQNGGGGLELVRTNSWSVQLLIPATALLSFLCVNHESALTDRMGPIRPVAKYVPRCCLLFCLALFKALSEPRGPAYLRWAGGGWAKKYSARCTSVVRVMCEAQMDTWENREVVFLGVVNATRKLILISQDNGAFIHSDSLHYSIMCLNLKNPQRKGCVYLQELTTFF